MGDRKPKKHSSGNSDAYKTKQAKHKADRPPTNDKGKNKKK